MTGNSQLVCRGFLETDEFAKSKAQLMERSGLTERQVDDRLEALL